MKRVAERLDKLRRRLKKSDVGSLLVTDFTNVTYLTGFTGDDSYLLVMPSQAVIVSDSRYSQQLAEECPGFDCTIRNSGTTIVHQLGELVGKSKISSLGVESQSMTMGLFQLIQDELPAVNLISTRGLVEELREIKDSDEISEIRQAIEIAERAFAVIRASLRGELTEQQVAHEIEHQIRLFGGRGCSFDPIVAVGPRAALPHAVPTERRIADADFVLIDWGAQGRLYMSDLTRVLVTGKIPPKLERIYGVVLKAQMAAIDAIRPGASLHDVDATARQVIADAGFGKRFGHGLGHGFGLEIHESPRMAANQHRPLKAGMVVTVEPGIYVPNWGGVRIEDDILVTRSGHQVLTTVPKQFADCVLV